MALPAERLRLAEAVKLILSAKRKVRIAEYHLLMLEGCYRSDGGYKLRPDSNDTRLPEIRVQAHLEGVLYAYCAAIDKLSRAISRFYQKPDGYIDNVVDAMDEPALREAILTWQSNPIRRDATDIRNSATHEYYPKQLRDGDWEVDRPPPQRKVHPYVGPRDLASYARELVRHAREMLPLLDELESHLRGSVGLHV
jgi:hypothetical protein